MVLEWRCSTTHSGQVTGYKVGRAGDVDAAGHQIWYSGSKLGWDLSLQMIVSGWAATSPGSPAEHARTDWHHLAEALLPIEVVAALQIVRDLRRLLRATTPTSTPHPRVGVADQNRLAVAVRQSLDPLTSAGVLTSPSWPALAQQLLRSEKLGVDPGTCLATAARQCELVTADDVAAALHHRLARNRAPSPARRPDPIRTRTPRRSR